MDFSTPPSSKHHHPIAVAVLLALAASAVSGAVLALGIGMMINSSIRELREIKAQNGADTTKPDEPLAQKPAQTNVGFVPGLNKKVSIPGTLRGRAFDAMMTPLERERYANVAYAKDANCITFQDILVSKEQKTGTVALPIARNAAKINLAFRQLIEDNEVKLDAMFDQIAVATSSSVQLDRICKTAKGAIVTSLLIDDGKGNFSSSTLAVRPANSSTFTVLTTSIQQGEISLLDFFLPDYVEDKVLLRSGYGDAGSTWWQYHLLNTAIPAVTTVENCAGQYVQDGGDHPVFAEPFEYTCSSVYVPLLR